MTSHPDHCFRVFVWATDLDGHSRPLSQHAYKSLAAALAFQTEVLERPTIVRADVVLLVRSLRKPEGPELFVPVEVM
jgi:hypothetical protein